VTEHEAAHKAELQIERDEVSRLKAELKKAHDQNAEMEKAAAEEKKRQESEAQKLKELLEKSETSATSTQKELDALNAKARTWMSELTKINFEMASKFPRSSFLSDIKMYTDMGLNPV